MIALEPGRIRRSLTLDVKTLEDGSYRVTGGAHPHDVHSEGEGLVCDCVDSRYHAGPCKHRTAVYFHRQLDDRVREALRVAVGTP